MPDDEDQSHLKLRLRAAAEADEKTTRDLGRYPEDPVHYALKPTLGGLLLVIVTSTVLGVEPGGLQSLALLSVLGILYWVLHNAQSGRRREWDRVRQRHFDAALARLQSELAGVAD
ncbi:MAG: hypothetical protein ACK4TJ_09120 [Tabrizicola sp.]